MGDKQRACPNCGQPYAGKLVQRQTAGGRTMVLTWIICPRCHQVVLESWVEDEIEATPQPPSSAVPRLE
jgi:hypothetical protein